MTSNKEKENENQTYLNSTSNKIDLIKIFQRFGSKRMLFFTFFVHGRWNSNEGDLSIRIHSQVYALPLNYILIL